jgi:hypothetical protein
VRSQKGVGFRIQHPTPVARLPDGSHSWHLCFALLAPELICWGVMFFLPLNELLALFPRVLNSFMQPGMSDWETFNKSPHTDIPDAPFELEAEAKAVKACRDAGVRPF